MDYGTIQITLKDISTVDYDFILELLEDRKIQYEEKVIEEFDSKEEYNPNEDFMQIAKDTKLEWFE